MSYILNNKLQTQIQNERSLKNQWPISNDKAPDMQTLAEPPTPCFIAEYSRCDMMRWGLTNKDRGRLRYLSYLLVSLHYLLYTRLHKNRPYRRELWFSLDCESFSGTRLRVRLTCVAGRKECQGRLSVIGFLRMQCGTSHLLLETACPVFVSSSLRTSRRLLGMKSR